MAQAYNALDEMLREVLRYNPEVNFGDDLSSESEKELSDRQGSSESEQELEEDQNSQFTQAGL